MVQVSQEVLSGRFRLERPIDEGGMGTVWEATELLTGLRVAVKLLKDAWTDDPEMRRRILREARAATSISHPNVIKVQDLVMTRGGAPALVMDLLKGESLASLMAREQTLGLAEAAEIFLQVIAGLRAAHAAGVVHRDLKPANVFLAVSRGGARTVRVLDFGVAKLAHASPELLHALTHAGTTVGTVQYMAPEQLFGEGEVDARADVFSLGVMLYECLAGRRPFTGANVGQIARSLSRERAPSLAQSCPHVPRALALVIDRMLATDKTKRLSDLRELERALAPFAPATEEDALVTAPRRRAQDIETVILDRLPARKKSIRNPLVRWARGASPVALVVAAVMASAVFVAGVLAGGLVAGQ